MSYLLARGGGGKETFWIETDTFIVFENQGFVAVFEYSIAIIGLFTTEFQLPVAERLQAWSVSDLKHAFP